MIDPIIMYHPVNPGGTTWVEREAFRREWFPKGWLSFDDPYAGGNPRVPPGTLVDSVPITADITNATTTFSEISNLLRFDTPQVDQPIIIEANLYVASVGSASTYTFAFCNTGFINPLGAVGARRVNNLPTSSGEGDATSVILRHLVPPMSPAITWTVCSERNGGTGTVKVEANAFFQTLITAEAK